MIFSTTPAMFVVFIYPKLQTKIRHLLLPRKKNTLSFNKMLSLKVEIEVKTVTKQEIIPFMLSYFSNKIRKIDEIFSIFYCIIVVVC